MLTSRHAMILSLVLAVASPGRAAVLTATPDSIATIFSSAKGGDIIKLKGSFGSFGLQNKTFATTVTIDATKAVFNDSVTIDSVSNLKIIGGTFGSLTQPTRTSRAISIYSSSNIALSKGFYVGNGTGVGVTMADSQNVTISAGNFQKLRAGIGVTSSSNVRISSSRFIGMTSDGIDIADSHFVTADSNRCFAGNPGPGVHPDCVQLWSILGNPVQSDILLTKNVVSGPTQGLTSFNPENGGGLRITMTDNIISTSYPQGIACYACVDSIFTGNVLSTLPGAQWRTTMNIVGGSNNTIANNSIAAYSNLQIGAGVPGASLQVGTPFDNAGDPLPDYILHDLALASAPALSLDSRSDAHRSAFTARRLTRSIAAVPEPLVWTQLLIGFAFIGSATRLRAAHPHRG